MAGTRSTSGREVLPATGRMSAGAEDELAVVPAEAPGAGMRHRVLARSTASDHDGPAGRQRADAHVARKNGAVEPPSRRALSDHPGRQGTGHRARHARRRHGVVAPGRAPRLTGDGQSPDRTGEVAAVLLARRRRNLGGRSTRGRPGQQAHAQCREQPAHGPEFDRLSHSLSVRTISRAAGMPAHRSRLRLAARERPRQPERREHAVLEADHGADPVSRRA